MQRSCSFAGRLHPVQAWRPSSRIVRDLQGSLLASFRPVAALHCQVVGESRYPGVFSPIEQKVVAIKIEPEVMNGVWHFCENVVQVVGESGHQLNDP